MWFCVHFFSIAPKEPVEYVYRIQKEYLALVREDKNYDTKKD